MHLIELLFFFFKSTTKVHLLFAASLWVLLRYVLFSPTRWWRGSPTGHSLCWVNTAIKKHPFGVSIINPIHRASFSLICFVFIPFRADVQLGSAARLVSHQGLLWLVRVSPAVFLWCDVDAHIWHHIRTSGDVWAPLFLAAFPLMCLCVTCGHFLWLRLFLSPAWRVCQAQS